MKLDINGAIQEVEADGDMPLLWVTAIPPYSTFLTAWETWAAAGAPCPP
jgi:hypothetical protein